MLPRFMFLLAVMISSGLITALFQNETLAQSGTMEQGSGLSLFETEAIRGFDEEKVKKDPVCDRKKRPKIVKVEPDVVKPGDRIVIKGEYFGTKECFRAVNFSKDSKATVAFTYVDSSTIEATVPKSIPPGMTFVLTITGAGSAQSKALLVTR